MYFSERHFIKQALPVKNGGKEMKKYLALALAVLLVLGMFAGCGQKAAGGDSGKDSGNPVVKIGVFEPASGENGGDGVGYGTSAVVVRVNAEVGINDAVRGFKPRPQVRDDVTDLIR